MLKSLSDVLIVGGGPAGLATAIALADKGIGSTIVDFNKPPIDKPCGEGLMPDSLDELSRLGISIPSELGYAFTGIRFRRDDHSIEADFPEGSGLGVRRTVLHNALFEKAQTKPEIQFVWKKNAKLGSNGTALVGDQEIRYKWLVAADGLNSAIRKHTGLDAVSSVSLRYGFRQHFRVAPWTRRMEIYWSDHGQMYVTPISDHEVCVVYLSRERGLSLEQALPSFSELRKNLAGAPPASRLQGAITATRLLKRSYNNNIALIGDASGSVDAITGEGLALSFRQARALADSIERDDLQLYERTHESLFALPSRMAKLMLLLDRFPNLQPRIFTALASTPATFGKILASHVGYRSLPLTLLTEVPKVAWYFLFPRRDLEVHPRLMSGGVGDRYANKEVRLDREEVCQIA